MFVNTTMHRAAAFARFGAFWAGIALLLALAVATGPVAAQPAGDVDGDGRVSQDEFRNRAAKLAFDADTNRNGILDDSEYQFSGDEHARLDTNRDGQVQVSEFQASLQGGFSELDKNSDGFLDLAEQRARR